MRFRRRFVSFLVAALLACAPLAALAQGAPDEPQFAVIPLPDGRIALVGIAEPGAAIELLVGEEVIARAVANELGEWLMTPPAGVSMDTTFRVRITTADGRDQPLAGGGVVPPVPDTAPTTPVGPAAATTFTLADFAVVVGGSAGTGVAVEGAIGYPRVAVVLRGDSPWRLAERYYGDGTLYRLILDANRAAIRAAGTLLPGMVIVIPDPARRR